MSLKFINCNTPEEGIGVLAGKILIALQASQKVLWLISGGSNIPIAVEVMRRLKLRKSLTVALTDERFGAVGHADSNWRQLIDAGFDFEGIKSIPVLRNESLEQTVEDYSREIDDAFNKSDMIIAQFGIGADGHIAGILPNSPATETDKLIVNDSDVESNESVVKSVAKSAIAYDANPFTRITLTPQRLKSVNLAFAFVFGESKKEAVNNLRSTNLSINEQPAQLLKQLPEVYLFSDA